MNFFRGLLLVAAKEFRHLRHDRITLCLSLGIPIFAFLIFGYALETRVHDVPTITQNLDAGPYGRGLLSDFSRSPVFHLNNAVTSETALLRALREGTAKVAVQIPANYSTALFYGRPVDVRVWVDGSDAILASQTAAAARSIGMRNAVRVAVFGTAIHTPNLDWQPTVLFNPESRPANFFVPALCALFGESTTLLLVALSIAKEVERGTLDQLRITSIPVSSLIAGKLAAASILGLTVAFSLTGLIPLVFGIHIAGGLPLLCLALFAIQLPTLGLGLILTAEARNQAQALQLTYCVFLPAMLLSGLCFPRETMAPLAAALSGILPTTWSIQILRAVVLRGANFRDLIHQFTALAILTVLFTALGVWRLRRRLS